MGNVTNVLVPTTSKIEIADYVAGGGGGSYVEVGYTQEGVEFSIEVETNDVDVAEEVKSLDRYITKEVVSATVTLAETSLLVLQKCIPGAEATANGIKFGSGILQKVKVRITWYDQYQNSHVHVMQRATPTGTVTRKINRKTGLVGYQVTFMDLATEAGADKSYEDHTWTS